MKFINKSILILGTFGNRGGRGPVPIGRGGGNQGNKNKKLN